MIKFDISSAPEYNEFLASVAHLQPDFSFRSQKIEPEIHLLLESMESRKAKLLEKATKVFIESLNENN